jgi:hypothetical protein
MFEAEARRDLESDGCAPCYPPHLEVPIRDPPEEYRQIIEYWQSLSSTDDAVLCGQRLDWQNFRQYQRAQRYFYRKKPFSLLEAEVRERRQRNGLEGDVQLLPDQRQQNRQQEWIEFQDFHLDFLERMTKSRQELQNTLEEARKIAGDSGAEGSEAAAQDVMHIPQDLEYADRILRWHDVLLQWIEQQRVAMNPRPPPSLDQSGGFQNPSASRPRDEPSNTLSAVVEPTKSTPQNTEPVSEDTALTLRDSPGQIPKHWKTKIPRTKEKAIAQSSPYRVAKANRLAVTRTKSRGGITRGGPGTRQNRVQAKRQDPPSTERLLPTHKSITTRSGRISREPERWVPR